MSTHTGSHCYLDPIKCFHVSAMDSVSFDTILIMLSVSYCALTSTIPQLPYWVWQGISLAVGADLATKCLSCLLQVCSIQSSGC